MPDAPKQFQGVSLAGTHFTDVNLQAAQFADVNLKASSFSDVSLAGSVFKDVDFGQASIADSNLEGMRINGILVSDLLLAHARLHPHDR